MAKSRRRNVGSTSSRSNTSNRGGGVMRRHPDLPPEVIIDILSRVPPKQLWGFRFVSKPWFNLLTLDSQFIKLHSDRSIQTNNNGPNILALQLKPSNLRNQTPSFYSATDHASKKPTHLQLPFALDSKDYDISPGICNGLVCLSSPAKHEVYIWNPLTSDHVVIPYPSFPNDFMEMDCFTLGFLQATNQYKLVRLSTFATPQLSVYTLGVGSSWRNMDHVPNVFDVVRKTTLLLNGVLHLIVSNLQPPFRGMIVGFDLEDELLRHIPTPEEADLNDLICRNYFLELDGLLCLCAQTDVQPIQIWVMKEYCVVDSWIKQFTIASPEICDPVSYVKPLATHNGEIIVMNMKTGLIMVNPKTNSIRKLKGFKFQLQDAYAYVGSIASPRFICGLQNIIS